VVQVELRSVEPTSWEAREVTDRAVTVDIFETVGTNAAVAWVHVCALGSDGASVICALVDVGASAINIVVAVAFLKAFTHECSLVVLAGAVSCASAVVGSALVDINASVINDVISSIAAALIARVRVNTFVGCGTVMPSALAQALISVDAFFVLVNESIWTWLEATGVVEHDSVILDQIVSDEPESKIVCLRVLASVITEVVNTEHTVVVVVVVNICRISECVIESTEGADGGIIGVKNVHLPLLLATE
jgi:hypothetical protein